VLPDLMNPSLTHRFCLALCLLVGASHASGSTDTDEHLRDVALNVQVGRELAHALFTACSPHYRELGFDPRFFIYFWDTARFEVLEGARITLGGEEHSGALEASIELARMTPKPGRCEAVVREDSPEHRIIPGVSPEDLQLMRGAYLATGPDPHVARDKSLTNDCMKANFNARRLDFDGAVQRCACTLSAMHTVPSSDLDEWLRLARSGADVPMAKQPWFPALLPNLQACLAP
jgi:hypothetical protein